MMGQYNHPMRQSQFLEVLDRDEAQRRFHAALHLVPLGTEEIPLGGALGRVLAADVRARLDVPGFTRSNVDGFAVRAIDTFGAAEEQPRTLTLTGEVIATGVEPRRAVGQGEASVIATGGVLPRGADAVIMVEHTDPGDHGRALAVRRAVAPGAHLTHAGSDIARGETVLSGGTRLTARETGVLAALGEASVRVFLRPRVAILSTGDEIVPPGRPLPPGSIHDANATLLADAVREAGGTPVRLGIVPDEENAVADALSTALERADMVLLSGGTSKGAGDVNARAVARCGPPGILAHGVALKPGKPVCLAACGTTPVIVLPGFPTSALFTFHEFAAPVLAVLAGRPRERAGHCRAVLPARHNSEIGRTEYVLVGLTPRDGDVPPVAVPLGKGSGSVTAFGAADGFIAIPRLTEYLEAGAEVEVTLLGRDLAVPDLVVQGSHCLGLDILLGALRARGLSCRSLAVGSTAGLAAVAAGHADLAGIHLLDPDTGTYNRPLLPPGVELLEGYGRMQGVVFRKDDPRFDGRTSDFKAVPRLLAEHPGAVLINRNRGSGTRALLDRLLAGARPEGHSMEARSHHAVAAAVAQGRADWGVAIATVARLHDLGFLPLEEERFDFAVAPGRGGRPAVRAFAALLAEPEIRARLAQAGFSV